MTAFYQRSYNVVSWLLAIPIALFPGNGIPAFSFHVTDKEQASQDVSRRGTSFLSESSSFLSKRSEHDAVPEYDPPTEMDGILLSHVTEASQDVSGRSTEDLGEETSSTVWASTSSIVRERGRQAGLASPFMDDAAQTVPEGIRHKKSSSFLSKRNPEKNHDPPTETAFVGRGSEAWDDDVADSR